MLDYRFYELTYSLEGVDGLHFEKINGDQWRAATCNVKLPKGWKSACKYYKGTK